MVLTVTKPTVGGSEDSWGTTINTALDDIVLEINSNADGTNTVTPNLGTGWEVGGVAVTSTAAELNILDGATVTTDELNILDNATVTTDELNILDGDTTAISTTIVDADRIVVNDDGTMKQVAVTDLATYINASAGTGSVTSVAMTVPTGLSISGSPITTSGTLAITLASGYTIPQTTQIPSSTKISNWDTAYGWGNHASAGYLTSVPTTAADVGTYTFALSSSVPSPIPGGTVPASNLTYSDGSGTNNVGTSPSTGTWRLMAHYVNRASLFVRVS